MSILPTLLSDSYKGSITGLRARCNTQCDIAWDIDNWKANVTMTSDEDNNVVKVRCGVEWNKAYINGVEQNISTDNDKMPYVEVTLNKGQSVKVDFDLADTDTRVSVTTETDVSKEIAPGTTVSFNAKYTFSRKEITNGTWHVTDAATGNDAGVMISPDGNLTLTDALKGKTIKVYCVSPTGIKSNEIVLHVGGTAQSFGVLTGFSDDDLGVYISNDAAAKNLLVIWSAYDAEGKLVAENAKNVSASANGFTQVNITAKWPVNSYKSSLFIWDKDTLTPYCAEIAIK